MFSCVKNTFFKEHLRMAASVVSERPKQTNLFLVYAEKITNGSREEKGLWNTPL